MLWKKAQKLFDIQVSVRTETEINRKTVIIHSKRLGWKSYYSFNIDLELLQVGLETLVIPSSELIAKLETYLGEEIEFERDDKFSDILKRQQI